MTKASPFRFSLPSYPITVEKSEQVGYDNPLAVEVAKPLFDADIQFLSLTERPSYTIQSRWSRSWHTFYLVVQGSLFFESDKFNFELKAGEMCFCPAGLRFSRKGKKNQPVQWLYIRLKNTAMWEAFKDQDIYKRPYESADLLFLLSKRILDAHHSRNAVEINLAQSHCNALINLLKHELSIIDQRTHRYTKILRELITDIQKAPEKNWSISLITKRLKVSTRKLYRLFVKDYGIAPHEMVTKIRISRAAQYLTRSDENIGWISDELGYQSIYSFSNLFKKHTGLRPTEYRKKFKSSDT